MKIVNDTFIYQLNLNVSFYLDDILSSIKNDETHIKNLWKFSKSMVFNTLHKMFRCNSFKEKTTL